MTKKSTTSRRLQAGLLLASLLSAGPLQSQTTYPQAVMADTPLFYWNFDQEGIGAGIAHQVPLAAVEAENDLLPNGAAGRLSHGTLGSGLRLGSALSLEPGGFFQTAGSLRGGLNRLPGPWAIEVWMRYLGEGTAAYALNFGGISGPDNSPALIYRFKGTALEIFGGAGGRTDEGGPGFEDQNWHHVLAVYYGNGTEGVAARSDIWLDGVMTTSLAPFSRSLSLDRLVVGAALLSGVDGFTGNLDELAVYDLQSFGLADEAAVEAWAGSLSSRHRASAQAASGESYSSVVKADKPLLYWNFDEADPLEPAKQQMSMAATPALENLLLPVGVPVLSTHAELGSSLKLGRAADLNAGSFFYTRPLRMLDDPGALPGPYVLELWFQNQAANAGTYPLNFGDHTVAGGDNSPALIYNFGAAPLHLEFFSGTGQRSALAGPTVADQAWHHLVVAYYGGGGAGVADRLDFYLDRQHYPNVAVINQPLSLGGLVAGAGLLNGANAFTGRIDELAVYDLSGLADEAAVTAKVAAMVQSHWTAAGAAAPEAVVSIATPPQSVTADIGDTVTFSVSASVTGTTEPLTYQWFRDGFALVGETADTLTTPVLALGDVGAHSYTVRVTAGSAFKDSAAAVLTVNAPPALAQTAYAKQVIADAPLLYWNFDETNGPAKQLMPLSAAPGEGVNDLVPTSTAGRLDHAVAATGLQLGYSADFAGTGHFKKLLETGFSDLTSPFAVEFWVQSLAANPSTYLVNFGNHEVAGGNNAPALIYNFNPGYLELFGPSRTAQSGPQLLDNEWHHVMYVYYGDGFTGVAPLVEIYLDGQAAAVNNSTAWRLSFAGIIVGAALPNNANGFTGRIDELAVYDFATLPDEAALRSRVESLIASHRAASTGSPPATEASLNISSAATGATLTWTAGAGVVLQESSNLSTWTTVNGAVSPMTVPFPVNGRKFYRLARP